MATLIVTASEVAGRAGLDPLDEDARAVIERAIVDAQTAVEAHLGRPILPRTYTQSGLWPDPAGWPAVLEHQPVQEIVDSEEETDPVTGQPTGMFTVTYLAGLDAATDEDLTPIRTYVAQHAGADPAVAQLRRAADADAGRVVQSVSVEGQSVTYANDPAAMPQPGSGLPGAALTLASLDRWRLRGRRVFQRRRVHPQWPYDCWPYARW